MKDIKIRKLEKYDSENYEEIGFGVYFNKKAKNYCFSYQTKLEDGEDQYPLEDLLDKYLVSCAEFCGEEFLVDGEKISYVEVQTLSAKLTDLISILNYATLVGKEVQNVEIKGRCLLAKRYANGKVRMNDNEYEIPILANRSTGGNLNNFEIKYPEMNYVTMFKNAIEMPEDLFNYEPKFIFLNDNLAKVVCEPTGVNYDEYYERYDESVTNEQISFIYDLNGFIEVERKS